ncbi:hypothetical protein [Pseudobacillus badius]|uniref:hypothetical protein n=1 Tax=Bacillus badius TaxID=1455 RepID=UPI003D3309A5
MDAKRINFNKMLFSLKEKQAKPHIIAREMKVSERCKRILDYQFERIESIDFASFTLNDIEEVINELGRYTPCDQGFGSRSIMTVNRNNYLYRNERTAYAITRIRSSEKKNYDMEESCNDLAFI